MSRRTTTDSLIVFSAGVLILIGQSFLLIPHHLGELLIGLSPESTIGAGFFLSLMGMMSISLVALQLGSWKRIIVHIGAALGLAGLAYIYLQANDWVESLMIGGLAIVTLINAFSTEKKSLFTHNRLTDFAILLNLVAGILILAWDKVFANEFNSQTFAWRGVIGILFALAALSATAASVLTKEKQRKRILSVLSAIPWIGWCIASVAARSLPNLIPASLFALALLLADEIPWPRLKLPEGDFLGHRLILLAIIVQTAFLATVTILFNSVYTSQNPGLVGGGTSFARERDLIFFVNLGVEGAIGYALLSLIASLNSLTMNSAHALQRGTGSEDENDPAGRWDERIARLTRPFASSQVDTRKRLELLIQQNDILESRLAEERRRNAQFVLLSELSRQLEYQLDIPVAAQLTLNTLQRSLDCSFSALYLHDAERRELVTLAAAGARANILPPGYRQDVKTGVLGRAVRLRKTQIINDSRQDPDFLRLEGETILSSVIVPLIDHGHIKGVLEISDEKANAFNSRDIQIVEAAVVELLRAWEHSEYHQRLAELIQAGISLTTQPDPQAATQEVASIARHTLRARFTFVTLLDQEGNFTRTAFSGHAPRLLKALGQGRTDEPLVRAALNASEPFRVRDLRKYKRASHLDIDHAGLRSLIAIPIRLHRLSVGAILSFGKQGEVFFTENDESLASLLSSQASAAIESAWLSHELRTTLATTTQLYQLSFHVIQAEELADAARYIAETAQKVCAANEAGIVLLSPSRKIEANVRLNAEGARCEDSHPMELIQRAMETEQSIFLSTEEETARVCFPLKTPLRTYGALWLTIPEHRGRRYAANLQTLANQAAVALERSILLVESREQAKELESAYQELEMTYDRTLASLMSALDARDRETEGHSVRVSQVARLLGERMNLTRNQLKTLERGSLLHDIGKIGISDTILHKPGPLSENEWKIMRLHPAIGARIVEGIPFLEESLPVVRYHQERWDGSGYPIGISGKDIPFLARIFAVADAFDALISDRPYRRRIKAAEALQYLKEQAGILFDPEIVNALDALAAEGVLDLS